MRQSRIQSYLPKTGYVNAGLCGGYIIGGCVGILMNADGYYYYRALGATTPGVSPSLTYSPQTPQAGNSASVSLSYYGAVNLNTPLYKEPVTFKQLFRDTSIEVGVSAPGLQLCPFKRLNVKIGSDIIQKYGIQVLLYFNCDYWSNCGYLL